MLVTLIQKTQLLPLLWEQAINLVSFFVL
jgi:hypothetical protein